MADCPYCDERCTYVCEMEQSKMSKTDDVPNPQAFPDKTNLGMTLRDWFAGQALAHATEIPYAEYYGKNGNRDARTMIAEHCYDIADAMLRARSVTLETGRGEG